MATDFQLPLGTLVCCIVQDPDTVDGNAVGTKPGAFVGTLDGEAVVGRGVGSAVCTLAAPVLIR